MRLLQLQENGDIRLAEFIGDVPPYAILSHTWGSDDDEVTFKDMIDGTGTSKLGYEKILFCKRRASRDGLRYVWVDTCCIDKSSSAELAEAINSMFRWYQNSTICYVYLTDISIDTWHLHQNDSRLERAFKKSRWFTRGWTLQELLSPSHVQFFSKEEQLLGDKQSLQQILHDVTDIDIRALQGRSLHLFSVGDRLSWSANRITKREEDAAYCLLGIFDIHMLPIYGEGQQNAFNRLQEEIRKSSLGLTIIPAQNIPTDEAHRKGIHQWLSAPDPYVNYQQALKQRLSNTGLWFLESSHYHAWKTGAASFLWLHGIPGSGKTVLSSTIIQNLFESCHDDSNKAVVYFYFDFNDAQKQHIDSMVRSLICQLLHRSVDVPQDLGDLFSTHDYGLRQPSVEALLMVLKQMMEGFAQIYIMVDALDECSQRPELVAILHEVAQGQLQNSHLMVTSRRERDLETSLDKLVRRKNSIPLYSYLVDEDIRQYIRQRLSGDDGLSRWSKDPLLMQEIEVAMIQGSQGMFRWVVCQLDTLGKCRTRTALRKSLATLPPTLDKTYERILSKITEEDSEYALCVLRWLAFAYRPLSFEEISEVIAIDADRDPAFDRGDVLEDPMDVLDICSSLVTVYNECQNGTDGSMKFVVMLAHYSVKEYLLSDRIRHGRAARYSMNQWECHDIIARDCLGYLLQFQQPDPISHDQDLIHSKLARYCAEFWMHHAKDSGDLGTETARLATRLMLTNSPTSVNWIRICDPEYIVPEHTESMDELSTPLYYAALFGLQQLVAMLLSQGANVNSQYGPPLPAASVQGHEQIVKLLLAHGADINAFHRKYGDALQTACRRGHMDIVKLLINSGANVNASGLSLEAPVRLEMTALNHASSRPDIFELLIDNGANLTHVSPNGWTPIYLASNYGRLEAVKLLITRGVDPTTANSKDGKTPLMIAAERGHYGVVKLLLNVHGMNVNAISYKGETALMCAAGSGHNDIVLLLLLYGAHVKHKDSWSKTGIPVSAYDGSNDTSKASRATSKMELDYRDHYGRTTLWWAAAGGNKTTVETLLNEYHCDPRTTDHCGRSPALIAAKHGHRIVAKYLLQLGMVTDPHATIIKEDFSALMAKEYDENSHIRCDVCEVMIPRAQHYYHCLSCDDGDWDVCEECHSGGMTCMDNKHVLVKRVWEEGT